jgi:membrane protein
MMRLFYKMYVLLLRGYRQLNAKLLSIRYGEKQVSLHDTLVLFFYHIRSEDLDTRASSVAFKFTLALFPATIFLFTLVPYIPIEGLSISVLDFIERSIPEQFYDVLHPTLVDIATRKRGGLLSFGFLLALYFATGGMTGLITAFNNRAHETERRSIWQVRWTATALTCMLALVFIVVVFILVLGTSILTFLDEHTFLTKGFTGVLVLLLRYFLVVVLFFVGISITYFFAPSVRGQWKLISPGAVIASMLCLLASALYSYYLNHFFANDRLYGSLAAFIGLMLWFYLLSTVLIVGFEINMSVTKAYKISKHNFFKRKANNTV